MNKNDKVLVLGSRGLVGSSITRLLRSQGFSNILTPSRSELDLLKQAQVDSYFRELCPDYVFMAAAKVGGIQANNNYRADFIFQNLSIQNNVFEAAWKYSVRKLLFLGSSCIYPKNAPQPIKEEYLLTGPLEPTNEPYAIAKIAGLKMAESFRRQYGCNFISAMPTNLYGVNDNFDPENSHVIPGLISRMDSAMKQGETTFKIWGSGAPRREFLYVDDMAKACLFIMKYQRELPDVINIGSGEDIEIKRVAEIISDKLGYSGKLDFDTTKPDGTMRKLLNVERITEMGWKPEVSLEEGIEKTIKFYRSRGDAN